MGCGQPEKLLAGEAQRAGERRRGKNIRGEKRRPITGKLVRRGGTTCWEKCNSLIKKGKGRTTFWGIEGGKWSELRLGRVSKQSSSGEGVIQKRGGKRKYGIPLNVAGKGLSKEGKRRGLKERSGATNKSSKKKGRGRGESIEFREHSLFSCGEKRGVIGWPAEKGKRVKFLKKEKERITLRRRGYNGEKLFERAPQEGEERVWKGVSRSRPRWRCERAREDRTRKEREKGVFAWKSITTLLRF